MAIYLIDYENAKDISGIRTLTEKDTAILFYSKNSNNLTFETHRELSSARAGIEYKLVEVGGKNALDFQLSTYLGFLIKANEAKDMKIAVVSNDNGFSYLKSFWEKEKGITVELLTSLSKQPSGKSTKETPPSLKNVLKQSGLKLSENDIQAICKIVSQSQNKQEVNNALMKHFKDSGKAGKILKTVSPYIKSKK